MTQNQQIDLMLQVTRKQGNQEVTHTIRGVIPRGLFGTRNKLSLALLEREFFSTRLLSIRGKSPPTLIRVQGRFRLETLSQNKDLTFVHRLKLKHKKLLNVLIYILERGSQRRSGSNMLCLLKDTISTCETVARSASMACLSRVHCAYVYVRFDMYKCPCGGGGI